MFNVLFRFYLVSFQENSFGTSTGMKFFQIVKIATYKYFKVDSTTAFLENVVSVQIEKNLKYLPSLLITEKNAYRKNAYFEKNYFKKNDFFLKELNNILCFFSYIYFTKHF